MRNSRRKEVETKKKRRRGVLFTLGILVVISLTLTLVIGENGFLRYLKLRSNKTELQAKINNLRKENEEIQRQIDMLKKEKNPNLMEELARDQGFTKEDEIIFLYEDNH